MYRHEIIIEIEDDIVHAHSIQEWEELLLHAGVIQRDELPLSYGRIAEILAEEYHKYGQPYFNHAYSTNGVVALSVKETTKTEYTDIKGNTISTRLVPATAEELAKVAAMPEDPNTMQIGIMKY